MNDTPPPADASIAEELAAALDWWREAGVDCEFSDDATVWLSAPDAAPPPETVEQARPSAPNTPPRAIQAPAGEAPKEITRIDYWEGEPPTDLDAFRAFWLEAPGLDPIGTRGRVPPRGHANADLMVLVVDPEQSDRDTLLSAAQGRLLDRILAAMQIAPKDAYIASALPRHTPMADTQMLAAQGMDKVVQHHIALAAPKRIIAFGARLTPFVAESVSEQETSLREINYKSALPPILAGEGLESLIETPALKARFWRRWMEWSADHG